MKKEDTINKLLGTKLDEVLKFNHEFREESDRGCALMAAAYLDEALKQMLASYMVNDKRLIKDLFNGQGPLATFSSRINLAFALGKISNEAKFDLHIIRRIRNDFAHISEPIDFENESISNRCKELRHQTLPNESSSREFFTRAVMGVLAMIHIHQITANRPQIPKDINIQSINGFEETLRGITKSIMEEI